MDFRYTVHDPWHGEFQLDHCGALMDVEPMGEDYVRSMCHDIEDPTFDATAVASNPKAQVRPVHRPPRSPTRSRRPAPALRVDGDHRRGAPRGRSRSRQLAEVRATNAAAPAARPDRPGRRGTGRLHRAAAVRPGLRGVLPLRARADRRRGLRPDAPAQPVVPGRAPRPLRRPSSCARSRPSSWSASPASPRSGSAGPSAPTRCGRLELHPLLNPAAYVEATVADGTLDGDARPRPRGRRLDHPLRPGLGPAARGGRPGRRPAARRARSPARTPAGP